MSKQALGNALAGILFLIIAVVDFTRDDSGIGTVFLVFAPGAAQLSTMRLAAKGAER